jgi:carbamoyltransferase
MMILGVHSGFSLGQHDPAAALVVDGRLVGACEEERFVRVKSPRGRLPIESIRACLQLAGITIRDVDLIVHPGECFGDMAGRLKLYLNHYFGYAPPVLMIGHHLAHLASAFYASGFDASMCLSYDAWGDRDSAALAAGGPGGLEILETIGHQNSLGIFYATMTSFLGFHVGEDEYKVMGLAPFGAEGVDLSAFARPTSDGYTVDRTFIRHKGASTDYEPLYTQKLEDLLGPARQPGEPISAHHRNVAFAAQQMLEACALSLVGRLHALTGLSDLCVAGGVGLNCSANRTLLALPFVRRIFVQPAASDRGLALGCALHGARLQGEPVGPLEHAFLGVGYPDEAIRQALDLTGMPFVALDDPAATAARLLADQKIIGWFQGRSEYGPRALGNRSILADPRDRATKDAVNKKVKFREEFRPFAPSVLEEQAGKLFEMEASSPYMTVAVGVREPWRERLGAVTHVNGTARVQTVHRETSPLFHRLIQEFQRRTDTPAVLNTSFNIRGQPIVETPLDALATFASTGLDALILGNYLLTKRAAGV